jgi:3-hydroxybutyryl-CoA dehydrogenase
VISALRTSDDVTAFITEGRGRQVIRAKDRAGFAVNSLLMPYLLHAVRMPTAGIASAEDIDNGMRLGCGHPMVPLALIDLIGLDTIASAGKAMSAAAKEPMDAPPLLRIVGSGLLGKKTGIGFYGSD